MRIVLLTITLIIIGCSQQPAPKPMPESAPVTSRPAATTPAPMPATPELTHPDLAAELLAMRQDDQRVRKAWLANQSDPTMKAQVENVDQKNTARVIAIIGEHGWPGSRMVGQKGSGAAWTILQHSDLPTLKKYLPIMQAAAKDGELDAALVATTVDRVLVNEGKPQLYGTQFFSQKDQMVPYPIEDEAHLDERRKEMGLGPFSQYQAMLRKAYAQPKKE